MASPKMGLKTPLLPRTTSDHDAMRRRPTRKRISRFQAAALAILVGLFWLARTWQCSDPTHHHEWDDPAKVPLEIHIMSVSTHSLSRTRANKHTQVKMSRRTRLPQEAYHPHYGKRVRQSRLQTLLYRNDYRRRRRRAMHARSDRMPGQHP